MANPYLSRDTHIPFAEMTPQAVEPALDEALTRAQTELGRAPLRNLSAALG